MAPPAGPKYLALRGTLDTAIRRRLTERARRNGVPDLESYNVSVAVDVTVETALDVVTDHHEALVGLMDEAHAAVATASMGKTVDFDALADALARARSVGP